MSIGVAVVGTGFGQKIHIPGFQHHPDTELVAVWNRDLGKAKAIADSQKIPHAFNRLDKLLSLPEVEAVSISTPPFLHYEMGKQVLEAGKHLLLEKPMTLRVSETRELYQLAQQKGLIAIADFEYRFVPAWQRLAELLQEGYVGKTRLIKIDWLAVSRANPDRPWNWYSRKDKGGGALGAIGSHAFDYIHWLFGPAKRLCAHLSCAIPERPDPVRIGRWYALSGFPQFRDISGSRALGRSVRRSRHPRPRQRQPQRLRPRFSLICSSRRTEFIRTRNSQTPRFSPSLYRWTFSSLYSRRRPLGELH